VEWDIVSIVDSLLLDSEQSPTIHQLIYDASWFYQVDPIFALLFIQVGLNTIAIEKLIKVIEEHCCIFSRNFVLFAAAFDQTLRVLSRRRIYQLGQRAVSARTQWQRLSA